MLIECQIKMVQDENQPEVGWLGGWLYPQPTRVQTPGLTSVCLIKAEYSSISRPDLPARSFGGAHRVTRG
jgi:hypothetical protein